MQIRFLYSQLDNERMTKRMEAAVEDRTQMDRAHAERVNTLEVELAWKRDQLKKINFILVSLIQISNHR